MDPITVAIVTFVAIVILLLVVAVRKDVTKQQQAYELAQLERDMIPVTEQHAVDDGYTRRLMDRTAWLQNEISLVNEHYLIKELEFLDLSNRHDMLWVRYSKLEARYSEALDALAAIQADEALRRF